MYAHRLLFRLLKACAPLIFLTWVFIPSRTVSAQQVDQTARTLRVSPVIFQISLSPGKTTSHTIRIDNLTDSPIPLRIEAEPLLTPDNTASAPDMDESGSPFTSWVTIPRSDLIIPENGTSDIPFQITIPKELELGGFYVMMYLTPMYAVNLETPRVIPRIGIPVLGSIGVPENLPADLRALVESFSIVHPLTSQKTIDMLLRVKNTSLQHFQAKPMVTLTPLYGVPETIVFPEKIIMPGKSRDWKESRALPAYGIYRISLDVSLGGGMMVKKTAMIVSLPFGIIAVSVILIISACFVLFRGRNIRTAIRILVRGK